MIPINLLILIIGVLLLISVASSKLSDRFGIPALLLFLLIGMLAGSEGIGGIYFDDPSIAQSVGIFSLAIILFAGGLDTDWHKVKSAAGQSITLAMLGVLLTALLLGTAAHYLFDIPFLQALLLGAIVSSTDAAAVFSLLRSKGVKLQSKISATLELESGSNDPMAVFLTVGIITLIQNPEQSWLNLIGLLFMQMIFGALIGWLSGHLFLLLINRIRLGYEGLYPVVTFSMVLLTFAVTALINGSGFLAVYVLGLMLARAEFLHKTSLTNFFNGLAWLSQIVMFLVLGLFVFPSHLIPIVLPGILLGGTLMFIARPLGVFLCLIPFKFSIKEKIFIAWVGLRGAVPIILATYPMIAGIDSTGLYFNSIFFIVILSILVQGTSIPLMARKLGVEDLTPPELEFPIQSNLATGWAGILQEVTVPDDSPTVGKAIYQLSLPRNYVVVLIARGDRFVIPNGSVVLQAKDRLLGLASATNHERVAALLQAPDKLAQDHLVVANKD
jgi:cell volume regulation protein A